MAGTEQQTSQHSSSRQPGSGPVARPAAPAPGTHSGHGNTIAAWACVSIIMLATLVMGIAVAFPNVAVFVIGAVLVVVAVVVGKVLAVMGFGAARKPGH